jgi:hypothetical protein
MKKCVQVSSLPSIFPDTLSLRESLKTFIFGIPIWYARDIYIGKYPPVPGGRDISYCHLGEKMRKGEEKKGEYVKEKEERGKEKKERGEKKKKWELLR